MITQDNYNRDLILRIKEERTLNNNSFDEYECSSLAPDREERSLNNNAFLGEYECSSLALDREERRYKKKLLDHLKQDQTVIVIKRFSERKKDGGEGDCEELVVMGEIGGVLLGGGEGGEGGRL
nr:hypothetical protein [Tanacetum cinerariifolium]